MRSSFSLNRNLIDVERPLKVLIPDDVLDLLLKSNLRAQEYEALGTLRIDLQEGFENDTVIIHADGREILNASGITTRLQIGLADSLEYESSRDEVVVEVSLTRTNILSSVQLKVEETPYLGISIESDGRIVFVPSSEPFGYL